MLSSGREIEALSWYAQVQDGPSEHGAEAASEIAKVVPKIFADGDRRRVLLAMEYSEKRKAVLGTYPVPASIDLLVAGARKRAASDTNTALAMVRRAGIAAHPDDPKYAIELAPILEANGQGSDAVAVLGPYRAQLGLSEAACILGQSDDKERQYAARKCALLVDELDEEICWLERSDPDSKSVQASLNETKARKARREEKFDDAARYLRTAIDIYASREVSSTSSNNLALAAFALQRLRPEPKLLERARAKMIAAATLSPSNAIELGNAADNLLEFAQAQERTLGLDVIDWNPRYTLFRALWNTAAERTAQASEFAAEPGVRTAATYLSKALVLRPKDRDLYELGRHFYTYRRDPYESVRYLQQFRAASQDRSDYAKSAADYYRGDSDESASKKAQNAYIYWAKFFANPSSVESEIQRTIQADQYVSASLRAARFDFDVQADAVVKTIAQLDLKHPSQMSRTALVRALLLPAYFDLHKTGALAASGEGCRRCLSPETLVSMLAAQDSPLGETVRAHAATRAAAERLVKDIDSYSGLHSPEQWALLARLYPDSAAKISAQMKTGMPSATLTEIALLRYPSHPGLLYERAINATLNGDEDAAKEAMATFARYQLTAPLALP